MKMFWIPLLLLCAHIASAQELRTWTSRRGKTAEASFVKHKFSAVVRQATGGNNSGAGSTNSAMPIRSMGRAETRLAGTTSATQLYPAVM